MKPKVLNKHRLIVIPENTIYIGRGSKWGNPFILYKDGNRKEVIEKYIRYAKKKFTDQDYDELRGKNLLCFCAPLLCHGDFLLERANRKK